MTQSKISEDCKTKPNIEDGTVAPDQSPISSGASYEVTCNDGFVISGPSTVTCTAGKFSQLPTCEPGYYYSYLSFILPHVSIGLYNVNTPGTNSLFGVHFADRNGIARNRDHQVQQSIK